MIGKTHQRPAQNLAFAQLVRLNKSSNGPAVIETDNFTTHQIETGHKGAGSWELVPQESADGRSLATGYRTKQALNTAIEHADPVNLDTTKTVKMKRAGGHDPILVGGEHGIHISHIKRLNPNEDAPITRTEHGKWVIIPKKACIDGKKYIHTGYENLDEVIKALEKAKLATTPRRIAETVKKPNRVMQLISRLM